MWSEPRYGAVFVYEPTDDRRRLHGWVRATNVFVMVLKVGAKLKFYFYTF